MTFSGKYGLKNFVWSYLDLHTYTCLLVLYFNMFCFYSYFITIFVAAYVLLIVLQEIRPDGCLEKAETYCLIDYIVGLCVYFHKVHIDSNIVRMTQLKIKFSSIV